MRTDRPLAIFFGILTAIFFITSAILLYQWRMSIAANTELEYKLRDRDERLEKIAQLANKFQKKFKKDIAKAETKIKKTKELEQKLLDIVTKSNTPTEIPDTTQATP